MVANAYKTPYSLYLSYWNTTQPHPIFHCFEHIDIYNTEMCPTVHTSWFSVEKVIVWHKTVLNSSSQGAKQKQNVILILLDFCCGHPFPQP